MRQVRPGGLPRWPGEGVTGGDTVQYMGRVQVEGEGTSHRPRRGRPRECRPQLGIEKRDRYPTKRVEQSLSVWRRPARGHDPGEMNQILLSG